MEYATSWCRCNNAVNDNGNIVYTPWDPSKIRSYRGYIHPDVFPTDEEVLAFERNNNTDTTVMCAVFVSPIKINVPGLIISEETLSTDNIKPEFEQQKAELNQRNEIRLSKHKQEIKRVLSILDKAAEDIAPFIETTGDTILALITDDSYFEYSNPEDWEYTPREWFLEEYKVKTLLPWNSPEAELIRSKAQQVCFFDLF
jgi:hypothetical protein